MLNVLAVLPSPAVPVLTWNLFLTAILIPVGLFLLYEAIKRQFKQRDAKDEEIAKLELEKDVLKEQNIKEWRDRFSTTQCAIKNKLDDMTEVLNQKVSWDYCEKQHLAFKSDLKSLDDRMRGVGK
jgi:hypothetical protein